MGLFDFALRPGQRFAKEEIRLLDQCFNSISSYTKKNYTFYTKSIADNINGSHYGVDHHEIKYIHQNIDTDENDPNFYEYIICRKYFVQIKRHHECLKRFYEEEYEDSIIKVPKARKYPSFFLMVGSMTNGFMSDFIYNSENIVDRTLDNPYLSDACIQEIKSKSIKFLKNFDKG